MRNANNWVNARKCTKKKTNDALKKIYKNVKKKHSTPGTCDKVRDKMLAEETGRDKTLKGKKSFGRNIG